MSTNRRDPEAIAAIWHWSFVALYLGAMVFHLVSAQRHWRAREMEPPVPIAASGAEHEL